MRQDLGFAIAPQARDRRDVLSISGGCALGCCENHAERPWAKMGTP
jgi:hypothetical protein